jgi:hypothetical protein
MKWGAYIMYHPMVSQYLEDVKKQFPEYVQIISRTCDFKEKPEALHRNDGLNIFMEYDYVFCMDADEFINPDQIEFLIKRVENDKPGCVFLPLINYADSKHIYPENTHHPVVIVKPKTSCFYDKRCLRFEKPVFYHDIPVHHLGYVLNKKAINWKIKNCFDDNKVKTQLKQKKIPHEAPEFIKKVLKN